ncbi:hypothetical protein B0H11DRAFT_1906438 [Mycena galericulata]|nr:hypothetical protein B0H11DRAFT_1906438 [Mycena galericulata]
MAGSLGADAAEATRIPLLTDEEDDQYLKREKKGQTEGRSRRGSGRRRWAVLEDRRNAPCAKSLLHIPAPEVDEVVNELGGSLEADGERVHDGDDERSGAPPRLGLGRASGLEGVAAVVVPDVDVDVNGIQGTLEAGTNADHVDEDASFETAALDADVDAKADSILLRREGWIEEKKRTMRQMGSIFCPAAPQRARKLAMSLTTPSGRMMSASTMKATNARRLRSDSALVEEWVWRASSGGGEHSASEGRGKGDQYLEDKIKMKDGRDEGKAGKDEGMGNEDGQSTKIAEEKHTMLLHKPLIPSRKSAMSLTALGAGVEHLDGGESDRREKLLGGENAKKGSEDKKKENEDKTHTSVSISIHITYPSAGEGRRAGLVRRVSVGDASPDERLRERRRLGG